MIPAIFEGAWTQVPAFEYFPADTFAHQEDLPWLIYAIAYGNHPEVSYALESLPGEPVTLGRVRVKPFQLVKK